MALRILSRSKPTQRFFAMASSFSSQAAATATAAAPAAAAAEVESPLVISQLNNLVSVQLNRPKALNALNLEMCTELRNLLIKWKNASPSTNDVGAFVVKGAGGKAFCAGGDVKSIWQEIKDRGDEDLGTGKPGKLYSDFFRVEYQMNYLLGTSAIPQISLWDGIVMGGGVGVSVLGEFRIATEKTMFAMPETAIGLFPDVGSSGWLPHLKNGFGLYIGLTGTRLYASDLVYSGIATHYVPSDRLIDLEQQIAQVTTADPSASRKAIKGLLKSFSEGHEINKSKAVLQENEEAIKRCFEQVGSIEEVMSNLEKESQGGSKWASTTLEALSKSSPTSLKMTFEQLKRGKDLDMKGCFEMEYRMVCQSVKAGEFSEGVRALLVDKDNRPQWKPATIAEVTNNDVEKFFKPLGEFELNLNF